MPMWISWRRLGCSCQIESFAFWVLLAPTCFRTTRSMQRLKKSWSKLILGRDIGRFFFHKPLNVIQWYPVISNESVFDLFVIIFLGGTRSGSELRPGNVCQEQPQSGCVHYSQRTLHLDEAVASSDCRGFHMCHVFCNHFRCQVHSIAALRKRSQRWASAKNIFSSGVIINAETIIMLFTIAQRWASASLYLKNTFCRGAGQALSALNKRYLVDWTILISVI